ncbi:MAG: hypothetical protein ABIF85_05595 [Nanoarchaeota archaeon]|nr:hypothetical protein [Nanoarchaeota archaeon]MBU4301092.1 hypothetical protein [Nanoarchaeota archaeon]MBU4451908.1 hypothetical protein [Nanoarchaeota archaeon]MCG2724607.1 hypothetical protein [archaeon]
MERQEDIDDFSSREYVHLEPPEWLKPGVNMKELPNKFKIYSKSLNEWLFFERTPTKITYFQVPREMLKKFPPNSGTYEVADAQNPVAVIVPSQNNTIQSHAVGMGAGISGPCMTPRGVELVIANTVYNPNIRWIILAGNDSGHMAGDIIKSLVLHGIDDDRRVKNTICPTFPYLKNLPGEVIERFRSQIEVIDLLKCSDIEVIGFVIRICLQECENAFFMSVKGRKYHIYDKGAAAKEPLLHDFSLFKMGAIFDSYGSFSGTSINAMTVSDAFSNIQGHIMQFGSWGKQESTRMALDCANVSITLNDVENGRIPKDYRPQSWIENDEGARDYLEKYSRWVYLFPIADVKYDPKTGKTVPKLIENIEYSYGTRLTAYGFESCKDKYELQCIKELTDVMQKKFAEKVPAFEDVLGFYDSLSAVQAKTFNSFYRLAKGCATVVADGIGNSNRLYVTLQVPQIDLAKDSPYDMHNPCFCYYQPNARYIRYGTVENDGRKMKTFLSSNSSESDERRFSEVKEGWFLFPLFAMRAHDVMAFPSNVAGGLALSEFIAWYATKKTGKKVEIGQYTQFASALHIVDYAIDKKIIDKLNSRRSG